MIITCVVMTTSETRWMVPGEWDCGLDVSGKLVTVVLWDWHVGVLRSGSRAAGS
jgi:hypothetical protein